MTVAVQGRTRSQQGGRRSPNWTMVGVAAGVLALVLIGLNWWIAAYPPLGQGSVVAAMGEGATPCDATSFGGDASLDCYEVPFQEGAKVGIGFSVRNEAPIPMTILSVETVGVAATAPAVLEPQVTRTDGIYGLNEGRAFEPFDVAPGDEGWIQLVGTYADCEQAAKYHPPGSAMIVADVRMTVRWAIFESDVLLPLPAALSMPGPSGCPSGSN